MKNIFSLSWIKSIQVRKQRKYRHNAPSHIRRKFMGSPLSKELKEQHNVKTVPVIKGDKVLVMRGQFKGTEGLVESVDIGRTKIKISGVQLTKKDGSKVFYPINPSNVKIVELNLKDKKRLKQNGKKSQ